LNILNDLEVLVSNPDKNDPGGKEAALIKQMTV